MLQSTHPVNLQIKSLEFEDGLSQNLECCLSLMKGLQNFGELRFVLQKEFHKLEFEDGQIIKFFYIPRLTSRKDVFFKITLNDVQDNEQIGDIPISTNMLADTFGKDKDAIIQETKAFFPGVNLHYKIFQPKFQIRREPKLAIKSVETDNIVSAIFGLHSPNNISKPQKKPRLKQGNRPEPLNIFSFLTKFKKNAEPDKNLEKQNELEKKQEPKQQNLFAGFIPPTKPAQPKEQEEDEPDILDLGPESPEDYPQKMPMINVLGISQHKSIKFQPNSEEQPPKKEAPGKKNLDFFSNFLTKKQMGEDLRSVSSLKSKRDAEDILGRAIGMVRDSQHQKQRQKHKLIPLHEAAHTQSSELSLKLKFVIFLVFFGLFIIIADFYGDKPQKSLNQIKQSKEELKNLKIQKAKH